MNILPETLLPALLRAAVMVLGMMLVMRATLWLLSIRHPVFHRWACVLVLLQGWIIAPLVIAIPWYDPPTTVRSSPRVESAAEFALQANQSNTQLSTSAEKHFSPINQSATKTVPWFTLRQLQHASTSTLRFAWLFGILAIVFFVAANYFRYYRIARSHSPITGDEQANWQSLLAQTSGPLSLPLKLTAALGPMLCLLPRGYELWIPRRFWHACSPAEQEAIVRHELSHYRRGDVWKTWLMYFLALPQWFNPAAWWAVWHFQQAGEWLCDLDAAAASPQRRTDYLQALLRLVELQPPAWTHSAAGQCAHAHPLLVRVRRLVSPQPLDSFMNKLLFAAIVAGAVVLPLVRIELVARAADPPASLLAVKDRIAALDGRLVEIKDSLADLKKRGEELKGSIETKIADLNKLVEDPANLSAELKERAKAFMDGDEKAQLEIVKDLGKLTSQDEQILALGRVAKDSPHESVRRLALQQVLAKGEAAYPAVAMSFEALNNKDRGFLALELNKLQNNDKLILFLAMAKNADDELLGTLLGLELTFQQRMMLLAALAESHKDDEKFAERVLVLGDKTAGDDGLLILYATAKTSSAQNVVAAVKHATKRKAEAWPVLAVAYKKEDKACRVAVIRAAKELGGEGADFLIKHALEDSNAELRAAAEEAVK